MAPWDSIIYASYESVLSLRIMNYVSSNFETDVKMEAMIVKMALRYSLKRTEPTNSNVGLLISKLYQRILKTSNMFIHPTHTHTFHPMEW